MAEKWQKTAEFVENILTGKDIFETILHPDTA